MHIRYLFFMIFIFYLETVTANETIIERVGYARSLESGELLYIQTHREKFIDNQIVMDEVTYRDSNNVEFAKKTVDYSEDIFMPAFKLINHQTGHIEVVERDENGLLIEFKKNRESTREQELIALPEEGIIDAGFDQFIVHNWEQIIQGTKVNQPFLVPSLKKFVSFRIYQTETDSEYQSRTLIIEPESAIIRLFTKPIELKYNLHKPQLISYKGISNMRDQYGENMSVDIIYDNRPNLSFLM